MMIALAISLVVLSFILGYRVAYIRHSVSFSYLLEEVEHARIIGAKMIVEEITKEKHLNNKRNLYEVYEEVEKKIKKEFERNE